MKNNIGNISVHDDPLTLKNLGLRQPGDLGALRGVIDGFPKEARTRGIASLTLVRFAFIGCNYIYVPTKKSRQFWDVLSRGRFGSVAVILA